MRRVSDLKANPKNPRKITDQKLVQLKKSMDKFGDISGIVFNETTGNLVGGNQRSKDLDKKSKVVITKRFSPATAQGTIAVGYIIHKGERFSYREVRWEEDLEKAAMIAANKNAGEWDENLLAEHLKELSGFDVDFDASLTMFDDEELQRFGIGVSDDEKTESIPGKDEQESSPSKLIHECPRCGYSFR